MHAEPFVRFEGVSRTYPSGITTVRALDDLSLTIARGERLAILGRSGSGKSTLLHLLGGLDRPDAGRVVVGGVDLAALDRTGLARHRLREVGVIFQGFHLVATQSAQQNVELPMVFAGVPAEVRRARARDALERVRLGMRLRHRPAELSGGECQRVAIARALINDPGLVLADEPTGNLDSATADQVLHLLLEHLHDEKRPRTLVLVTHDRELARRVATRIVTLSDGRLVSDEPVPGGDLHAQG